MDTRSCLLSNGRLTVMLRANGSGFTRWRDLAVTRWREDATRDDWGTHFLIGDASSGQVWSATRAASGDASDADTEVEFDEGIARFRRSHGGIESLLEIAVAADADVELRRLTLRNLGDAAREISVTTFAEVVVGPVGADNAHPAFSKMFVQTDRDPATGALLATRRQRAAGDPVIWAAQSLEVEGEDEGAGIGDSPTADTPKHETDRARFLGRCRSLADAAAMAPGEVLSGTVGCVLDPVFALRRHISLAPGRSVSLLLWTALADSREAALAGRSRGRHPDVAAALFEASRRHAAAERSRLAMEVPEVAQANLWLGALLVADPAFQAVADQRALGRGGPPTLWGAGISGDRPIVLLTIREPSDLPRVRPVLRAQDEWRSKRFGVDIVLLNEASGTAADLLQATIGPWVDAQRVRIEADKDGVKVEVFGLRSDALGEDLRHGLFTAARIVLDGSKGGHSSATSSAGSGSAALPRVAGTPVSSGADDGPTEFDNGSGAFVDGGRAYRIDLNDGRSTPMPWVNVIANPGFGCLVSAEGGGYSWALNSQQNPLTPWPNDPVSDEPSEVLYLRDAESGTLWSATAAPIRIAAASYATTHGKGWSRFTTDACGIDLELTVCVAVDDPVKMSRLRLRNRSARTRRLSVTGYVRWALGPNGTTPAPFVSTSRDPSTGALFARNPWRPDFGGRVSFVDLGDAAQAMLGDRSSFIGPRGSMKAPEALQTAAPLSGTLGAGLDPCGAVQAEVEIPPGTEIDLLFLLGDAESAVRAQALVARYRSVDMERQLADIDAQWRGVLNAVQVHTPDRAMDVMLNDWLLYQALGCRVWARTGYYQASGAYGFRDQLQDVMALCISRPDLAREHLLRAAGRQFPEGDVQHWWLPPGGQGIRTRISDDRCWLAHVALHYVAATGDAAVLDEPVAFLTGATLDPDAPEAFFQPGASPDAVSVYEHCARALDASLAMGEHGLPLMQTGDWNDGMNRVGEQGRGESVWLGWFLLSAIEGFVPVAEQRGDTARVARWRAVAASLAPALEGAWDGAWYRRGYYDDGTPLGSASSDECRIDTIAQSWSAIAGTLDGARRPRAAQAMASVDELLVDHEHAIARLFTPPFDSHSLKNPGYIKGYPPGVRENGGQYTHGATWSVFAWAQLGEGDRAAALFSMLNPIRHSETPEAVTRYKVEPYAACADVYSVDPHIGRGGWTWYTGSAAWLYRAGVEAVLGFHLAGNGLRLEPCIPASWPGFRITYRRRAPDGSHTTYEIAVENPDAVCDGLARVELDGNKLAPDALVPLVHDGVTHRLRVWLGNPTVTSRPEA